LIEISGVSNEVLAAAVVERLLLDHPLPAGAITLRFRKANPDAHRRVPAAAA
jgi:hypothetical protein